MPTVTTLRITVLDNDGDVWCDWCGLPCATTIIYVVEASDHLPTTVHRLDYCEGCEEEAPRR